MLEVLRHQDLEGVLATVVRYYGGIPLGAGGLVRAYTDSVAKALLTAEKIQIIRQQTLHCAVPYALEGLLRREIELAGATGLQVSHAENVKFAFNLPEQQAEILTLRLNEACSGRLIWRDVEG